MIVYYSHENWVIGMVYYLCHFIFFPRKKSENKKKRNKKTYGKNEVPFR